MRLLSRDSGSTLISTKFVIGVPEYICTMQNPPPTFGVCRVGGGGVVSAGSTGFVQVLFWLVPGMPLGLHEEKYSRDVNSGFQRFIFGLGPAKVKP